MNDTSQATPTPVRLTEREALAHFGSPETDPELRHDALTVLISTKLLPKQADRPEIAAGLQHWLRLSTEAQEPGFRLLAVAECTRLAQVVRRFAKDLPSQLQPAFVQELPPLQLLADADDRLNLARACGQAQADWLPGYLARAVADEETGEKARAEMVAGLLARSATLADGLRHLVGAFESLRPQTEFPGDTLARRLTRTLAVLRAALLETELDTGEDLGKALRALVAHGLEAVGRPSEEKVRIDLSREALLTVHDLVRTRLSVAADPEVYAVVAYCRKLCGDASWPLELAKPIDRLITDVSEALVLLGRQGQADQGLLSQLTVLCNHPERARAVARQLAVRHPEMPEEIRDWLTRGRLRQVRPASESALEAAAANADGTIGMALQAARSARGLRDGLQGPLLASLELFEPSLVPAVQALLSEVQTVAVQIEQAATLRSIDLHGVPGEPVEVTPKFFRVVGTQARQVMTVRQPAVVRRKADGSLGEVITPGLVD